MAFSHPSRHLPKVHMELLILGIVVVLLLISLLILHTSQIIPQERAVPQPVVAEPAVPVHFSKLQGSRSITEPSTHPLPQTYTQASRLHTALTELLTGPNATEQEQGYYSEIPKGTKLLDARVDNGTVNINLSREFTSGGGSTSMIQRVNELKSTINAVEGQKPIHILVEGKPLTMLGGEGLEIN